MKSILVTGVAGFIGAHFCERYNEGNEVICMDNYFTASKQMANIYWVMYFLN
ncbi:NAD-dependent epimerase/dehydratase family protein [Flavobacterium sp. DSR3-2]|uniref:NAD-dependent epimerase/dehydratase family protein n=1 Tax=Flavobacterium sp. DSR3-2 TaxID=2804634 RepID=UPI003CFA548D